MLEKPSLSDKHTLDYVTRYVYDRVHDGIEYGINNMVCAALERCINDYVRLLNQKVQPKLKIGHVINRGIIKEIDRDVKEYLVHYDNGNKKWHSYHELEGAVS